MIDDNHRALLDAAHRKSKREVEAMIAERFPQPDVPSTVRKLPVPPAPAPISAPLLAVVAEPAPQPGSVVMALPSPRPGVVAPLAPARYKVQFTADQATHDDLIEAQALLRHVIPDGGVGAVIGRALELLVADLRRRKCAATERPRQIEPPAASNRASRTVPAAVRRAVWARDGGRCAFVSADGRRCSERGRLELHHIHPHALGGPPTVENIQLRCTAHNGYEAELAYGAEHMARARQHQPAQADLF